MPDFTFETHALRITSRPSESEDIRRYFHELPVDQCSDLPEFPFLCSTQSLFDQIEKRPSIHRY